MSSWFKWFPSLYSSDTLHLNLEQDAIYRRLIDHYMTSRRPIPDNNQAIANIARVGIETWVLNADTIRQFFRKRGSNLHLTRCDDLLDAQDLRMKKLSEIGKKGAEARHSKNNDLLGGGKAQASARATAHGITHGVQEIEVEDSVANATGKISPAPVSPNDRLWGEGVAYLTQRSGKAESNIRSLVGRWLKSNSADDILAAISKAQIEQAVEPIAYVSRCLGPAKGKTAAPDDDGSGYRRLAVGGL